MLFRSLTGLTKAFVISDEQKNVLVNEDKRSPGLFKTFLLGRNIKSYATPRVSNWIIAIPIGFTIKKNLPKDNPFHITEHPPRYGDIPGDNAWSWFSSNYPAIASYLVDYKEKAEKRLDKEDFWWELRACD